MASRHLSRSIAMQTLYEWDFNDRDSAALPAILEKNIREFAPGLDDSGFPKHLVEGVIEKVDKLDAIIEKAAPEWPIQQIAVVDRNILRLGLYELLFGDHSAVPPKVAINEAIELAKSFGGESSGKFVNGVLGTIYRELGEPGKEHARAGGIGTPRTEDYVGAIIARKEDDKIHWVMVLDIFNRWTFVKGHKQPDETDEEAALREVREEVGVGGVVRAPLGENTYPATTETGESVLRKVKYFLVETADTVLTLEENAGLTAAKWIPMEEVTATKHYEDTNQIIAAAMDKVREME